MPIALNLRVNPDSFVADPGPWALPSVDAAKRPDEGLRLYWAVLWCTGQERETGPLTHPPREAAWALQCGNNGADPVGWAGDVA